MFKVMRNIALFTLKLYQKVFTLFSYGCCRYYPTCSEYAKWQILHNSFIKACFYSFLRILRCNQLFSGGIDYPVISKSFKISLIATCTFRSIDVKFWFVPKNSKSFYAIKAFNPNHETELGFK
jgi:putative membrane protein insertion efficiency factor